MILPIIALALGARVARGQGSASNASSRAAAPARNEIFAGVDLTSDQRIQLRVLTLRTRSRIKDITGKQQPHSPLSGTDRAALERIVMAHRASLRGLLAPDQREKLDENQRNWNERREKEQKKIDVERAASTRPVKVVPAGGPQS